jgi:parallel beta helix pectate lyase-like protein
MTAPFPGQGVYSVTSTGDTSGGSAPSGPTVPIQQFGAKSDVQTVHDASIGLAGTDVHSPSAPFKLSDVGKICLFPGAGAGGITLQAAITAFISATDVTIAPAAAAAVASGGSFAWGTDSGPALTAARAFFTSSLANAVLSLTIVGQFMFGNGVGAWPGGTVLSSAESTLYAHLPGIAGDDDPTACIFFATTGTGAAQALSSNAAIGATSVVIAALPAGLTATSVGVPISLTQGAFGAAGSTYIVQSVTGGGPFTLNLDRALMLPFTTAASSQIAVLANQTNFFTVDLGGATVTGPGGRYFECFQAQHWRIRNVSFSEAWGIAASPFAMESYCYDCVFSDCEIAGATASQISSGEHCFFRNMVWSRMGATGGVTIFGCVDCWVIDGQMTGCSNANGPISFTDLALGGGISYSSGMQRCSFSGNALGFTVLFGDSLVFDQINVVGSTGVGAQVGGAAGRTTFSNCQFQNNGSVGVAVNAGAGRARFFSCDFSGNATDVASGAYAAVVRSTCDFYSCTAVPPASGLVNGAVSPIDCQASFYGCAFTGGILGQGVAATLNLSISDTVITLPAGGYIGVLGDTAGASVISLRNVTINAAGGGSVGIDTLATTTVRMYDRGPTITGASTPTIFGGPQNRGATVQANGATPVLVAWPDLKTGELPKFELITPPTGVGGLTNTWFLQVTVTAGTGFAIVSQAGNNAVYQYEI